MIRQCSFECLRSNISGPKRTCIPSIGRVSSDEKFWGPAWYLDYDQFVYKQRLQIYHRQAGFAAVNESGKFLWRSWTGIRVPLIAGLVGSAEYEFDYDSEPAVEAETTDQTLKLKLGYKW